MVSCGNDDESEVRFGSGDTDWVYQPYDTTAANEGPVWRSEDHWIVQNNDQPQLRGYSVTLTHLVDSCFRSNVYVAGDHVYVRFFKDGETYRYRVVENDRGDTLLLALPVDSEEDFGPTSDNAFVFNRISDSMLRLQLVLRLDDDE